MHPIKALETLNEAKRRRPTGIAGLVRGSVRAKVALDGARIDDAEAAIADIAVLLPCLEFIKGFTHGAGRIINLTSGQGLAPLPDDLAYAATKGGVDALTLSLSAAVAGRGITVNAVDPGPTETGWMRPEQRAALLATAPMGRLGTPRESYRVKH